MTRSLSRLQAVLLGLVVLGGVALGGWAVFEIGSRQRLFAETYELRAGFVQANGIDRGTPVRVRGIDAGQVVGIELPPADQPEGKVFARLRIDKKFQAMIPTDSKARLLNDGMLGGRLINIDPGQDRAGRLQNGDEIAVAEARDLTDVMSEATATLRDIRDSNGTLAKLLKTDEAHKEMVGLIRDTQQMVKRGEETFKQGQDALREGKETLAAVKQDADAIKRLPLIRGYVEDAQALIYRPDQSGDRRVYTTSDLFEPGRAVLSDAGKAHLLNLTPWLAAGKQKGSEVVVVSYADPASAELPSGAAQTLTLKQSEAVATFLKDGMKAHKTGWWSSRNVTPVGMGLNPPPVPEKDPIAPNRTEILVFAPRS